MSSTAWIITGSVLVATAIGGVVLYRHRKKSLDTFFNQVYMQSKQIPKKKKNGFLLLMFKESVLSSKKKGKAKGDMTSFTNKLQNPKYLNVQLVQMSSILRDRSKVKDKKMKRALALYDSYFQWEKKQQAAAEKEK
ncbi:MAG: hypothetical protein N4A40_03415 [Tissierellales bacterium]|jgi:hypothetical protein|nr:hypothetical protein [Tissierellales bacterium]